MSPMGRRFRRAKAKADEYWKVPEVGKRYRVLGWHTGDFEGECIAVFKTYSVLRVVEKKVNSELQFGQELDIPIKWVGGMRLVEPQQ